MCVSAATMQLFPLALFCDSKTSRTEKVKPQRPAQEITGRKPIIVKGGEKN
jgi:hypothetical protein